MEIGDRVHRWQVGAVAVVRVADDDFAIPSTTAVPSWAIPSLAPAADEVGVAFSVFAIRDGDRRIVVDPWLANDFTRAGPDAGAHVDGLLERLAAAGFPAEDVDVVVNTHWDGDGWNTRPVDGGWAPTFATARYLYPQAELDELAAGHHQSGPDGMAVLQGAGVLDACRAGDELSPHVRLVDALGHRAGHLAVRIESDGAVAVLPGHLFLNPLQVADPTVAADEDAEVATRSRRALLADLAGCEGLLLTTLMGGPGGGRVVRAADGRYELVDA